MSTINPENKGQQLLFCGIALFLLGLIAGLFIPMLQNPRMGLSSHLEGVINGMFLMLIGLIWDKIKLSANNLALTYWLLLYGSFANFIAVFIGAATGAGKLMPLAKGQEKGAIVEGIITFLLLSLSAAMLVACACILSGLYKNMKSSKRVSAEPSAV